MTRQGNKADCGAYVWKRPLCTCNIAPAVLHLFRSSILVLLPLA